MVDHVNEARSADKFPESPDLMALVSWGRVVLLKVQTLLVHSPDTQRVLARVQRQLLRHQKLQQLAVSAQRGCSLGTCRKTCVGKTDQEDTVSGGDLDETQAASWPHLAVGVGGACLVVAHVIHHLKLSHYSRILCGPTLQSYFEG